MFHWLVRKKKGIQLLKNVSDTHLLCQTALCLAVEINTLSSFTIPECNQQWIQLRLSLFFLEFKIITDCDVAQLSFLIYSLTNCKIWGSRRRILTELWLLLWQIMTKLLQTNFPPTCTEMRICCIFPKCLNYAATELKVSFQKHVKVKILFVIQ